jgi:hypothetical protein
LENRLSGLGYYYIKYGRTRGKRKLRWQDSNRSVQRQSERRQTEGSLIGERRNKLEFCRGKTEEERR